MGTSSNFGNMFSVTVAAAFLPFLAMLPFQILLNNLLYDTSRNDDPHRPRRRGTARPPVALGHRVHPPVHDPLRSDQLGLRLRQPSPSCCWIFHAEAPEFRSGWFVESLATQTLIVFVIRTRGVPFFRSRPSRPLLASVLTVVTVGALLPQSPLNDALGFAPLPPAFFAVLVALVIASLTSVEIAKYLFYKTAVATTTQPLRRRHAHRVHRLAARWSHHQALAPPTAPT